MVKKDTDSNSYSAKDISVLEGLEPVRKRPGMYIGGTGVEGLHHLIWEIFDNSRDEAMGGFADDIEVALLPGDRVRVVDNGRGIPVDVHSKTKVSALETIMTTLHAGGKFGQGGYKVSGGLHGVGASVVNALSVYMKATVHKDEGVYMQEYKRGARQAAVKKIGKTDRSGSVIMFEPDPEIFKEIKWSFPQVLSHLREQAYLVKKMRVTVIDAREYAGKIREDEAFYLRELFLPVPSFAFYFEGGIQSLVKFYNEYQKPVHESVFYVEKKHDECEVEIALQYVDDIQSREVAFGNNIHNAEGGTHVTGFRAALTRALNDCAKKSGIVKEGAKGDDGTFTGDDVREGLTSVISIKLPEIQFEGQTKAKLGSVEARTAVEKVFGEAFSAFLEEHPDEAKQIILKVILALRARKAAKAAKDSILRKGALEGMTLPGKLADCQSKLAEDSELFVVEGDSAGGSAKMGRDRRTQAILPLRGKILNIERARLDKMLASEQIKNLVVAMGAAIGDTFDLAKLRYHKIIIATDADVDGAHIRTLLLTLFYRYYKPVIDGGFVYIARPPLYKIKCGKEVHYVYTEEEKINFLGKNVDLMALQAVAEEEEGGENEEEALYSSTPPPLPRGGARSAEGSEEETGKKREQKISLQRYKGLGEMNPDELWETTMNPETRVLKQVNVEDAQEADKVFDMLMGTDVSSRKSFIQTNAKLANVDV